MQRSKKYFVYMLLCSDGTYYTGITTDIERRVNEHNGLKRGGARYTMVRRPVSVVYVETHKNRSEAQQREYMLRKLGRKEKSKLAVECPFERTNST